VNAHLARVPLPPPLAPLPPPIPLPRLPHGLGRIVRAAWSSSHEHKELLHLRGLVHGRRGSTALSHAISKSGLRIIGGGARRKPARLRRRVTGMQLEVREREARKRVEIPFNVGCKEISLDAPRGCCGRCRMPDRVRPPHLPLDLSANLLSKISPSPRRNLRCRKRSGNGDHRAAGKGSPGSCRARTGLVDKGRSLESVTAIRLSGFP